MAASCSIERSERAAVGGGRASEIDTTRPGERRMVVVESEIALTQPGERRMVVVEAEIALTWPGERRLAEVESIRQEAQISCIFIA